MTLRPGTLEGHLPTPELLERARRVDVALAEAGYPDLCVSCNDRMVGVSHSGSAEVSAVIARAFALAGGRP
jgi:hypothetical protein